MSNTKLSLHTHNGRLGDHLSDILWPVQRNGAPHLDEGSDAGPLQKGDLAVNHNLLCLNFISHMTLSKKRQTMQFISSPIDTHNYEPCTYLAYIPVFVISYWWLKGCKDYDFFIQYNYSISHIQHFFTNCHTLFNTCIQNKGNHKLQSSSRQGITFMWP